MKYIYTCVFALLSCCCATSCSDLLETAPYDALSPSTTWKTEADADAFATGCYNDWVNGRDILYFDCGSDIGYNNFSWEGFKPLGNGNITASKPGVNLYSFTTIRRCNTFLQHIDQVSFADESTKIDLIAQVRAIRAYRYFLMNFWYGGVAIIDNYSTADEAKVPRDTEQNVKEFIYKELDELIPNLNAVPEARGRIAKGTALAIKMRSALYWGDYERANSAAQAIVDLQIYELDASYTNLFTLVGQTSKEIICAANYTKGLSKFTLTGAMYNNADGGWSSIVPTQNLIDIYEMNDGLTKEESSEYDPTHPFANRDPRMAMTVLFPGMDWTAKNKATVILNTLDKEIDGVALKNYPLKENNCSKTSLTWAKYTTPMEQYADIWDNSCSPILFRYAEVLLTLAEADNELNGPTAVAYDALDKIRTRVGMDAVDRTAYDTKDKLRTLIRRERCVEFAGEGLRRADIVRWTTDGKMLAETLLNEDLTRVVGTIDYAESNPYKRAVIDVNAPLDLRKIETRKFEVKNRYLPIPQSSIDKNPQLEQNPGY